MTARKKDPRGRPASQTQIEALQRRCRGLERQVIALEQCELDKFREAVRRAASGVPPMGDRFWRQNRQAPPADERGKLRRAASAIRSFPGRVWARLGR